MNSAINNIIASLETFFAEQDATIADDDVRWALERVDAIRAFKASDEYTALKRGGAFVTYPKLFAIAGGKTWYGIFTTNSKAGVEEFVRKNAASTAEKRTAKIASKLLKSGVEQVDSANVAYTSDGFQGVFVINGSRKVVINVILAGGYHIQRLHQRVLCTVK